MFGGDRVVEQIERSESLETQQKLNGLTRFERKSARIILIW
jgi:hypothetical protein